MKRRSLLVLGVTWLGLLGFVSFKARSIVTQREQYAALLEKQRQLDAERAALRRESGSVAAELKHADEQLAAMPASEAQNAELKPEHRDEIDRWLARVRKLRQLFADKPDQRVPEMQFLKDEDWLRVAKTMPMETDEDLRGAAGQIRSRAIGYLVSRISVAARKYQAATKGERPAGMQALVPYFDGPVDPSLLERYEITGRPATMGASANAPNWGISNTAPIDPDYDTRYQLTPTGGMTAGSGLLTWRPELAERQRAAAARFRRERPNDLAKGLDDLLPYFDPPLERDLAERLRKTERR